MLTACENIVFIEVDLRDRCSTFRAFYEQLLQETILPVRAIMIGPDRLTGIYRGSHAKRIYEIAENLEIELAIYSGG